MPTGGPASWPFLRSAVPASWQRDPRSMYATVAALDQLRPNLFACYRGPLLPLGNGTILANELVVVWHLFAGSVDLRLPDGQLTVRAGSTVILPSGQARQQTFTPDAELLSVRFSLLWPDGSPLQINGLPLVRNDTHELVAAGNALVEVASPLPSPLYGPFERTRLTLLQHLAVQARLYAFLVPFLATIESAGGGIALRRRRDPRLTRCLNILHGITTCSMVPYPRLQEASGLSRAQIDRLLRAELGQTPKGIIDAQCLRRACTMLLEPGRTIVSVGETLGFCDPAHFRRWFQRQVHQTPQVFRERGQPSM